MIYAIVSFTEGASLPATVSKLKPIYNFYGPHAWFVKFDGTASELSDLIWPDDKDSSEYKIQHGMIFPVKAYNGFAAESLWEWLEVHDK